MSWFWLYLADLLAICLFLVSYYRNCYRRGYRVDFWHAQLFIGCVFPYMLMLFFASSDLNAIIVGHEFGGIVAAIPSVFLIVMVGYAAILLGGKLWSFHLGIGVRKAAIEVLETVPRWSMMLMSSTDLLVFLSLCCLVLQGLILGSYFAHEGFGFNLRAYTFANPGIRPFAQITALTSIAVASHALARYIDTRERLLLACTLLITFGLVFFGQRGDLVSIYINIVFCYLVKLGKRISLLRITALVGFLVVLGLYLGSVREGLYSIGEFFDSIVFLALYGNNFTDLRDLAWIYSDWNHHLWMGMSYLAGLATFVPRGASAFRAVWTFGVATGLVVGLDTEVHPGLKPGQFGESFLNFGWLGVIVSSLLFGILVRRVDMDVKAALRLSRPSMMRAFASTTLLTIAACINGSLAIPFLYALLGVYLFSWVYLRLRAMLFPFGFSSAGASR